MENRIQGQSILKQAPVLSQLLAMCINIKRKVQEVHLNNSLDPVDSCNHRVLEALGLMAEVAIDNGVHYRIIWSWVLDGNARTSYHMLQMGSVQLAGSK